jgi:superfamily I DNA/RNA helicase
MSATFWINTDDLDDAQRQAVMGVADSKSFLLKGPAGSGKTNILLLRAKWLTMKHQSDLKIVVFTQSLKNFVAAGCTHYGINPSSVVTQIAFFRDVLREHGVSFEQSGDFEADRNTLSGKMKGLVDSGRISNEHIRTLLIDEAQDYTDTELLVFRALTQRLVLATDSRQSIYAATHTPELLEKLVENNVIELRHHYRSGLSLCKVADAILKDSAIYRRVQDECRYDESERPSSVVPKEFDSFEDQVSAILEALPGQLDLYSNEQIGVLFPKKEQESAFRERFATYGTSEGQERVWIDTLHGSKGREFRAVHIAGCEALSRMGATQKRLIYTGILRGKTSVNLYFTGRIPGYLDTALATLRPPSADPSFDDLFRE